MSFWDDVWRNLTGGGDNKPKSQPRSQPTRQVTRREPSFSPAPSRVREGGGGYFAPAPSRPNYSPPAQQQRQQQQWRAPVVAREVEKPVQVKSDTDNEGLIDGRPIKKKKPGVQQLPDFKNFQGGFGMSRGGGPAPTAEDDKVSRDNLLGAATPKKSDAGKEFGNFFRDVGKNFKSFMETPVGPSSKEVDDFWANTNGQNKSPIVYDKETDNWTLEGPFGNPESRDKKQAEQVETIKTNKVMEEGTSDFQKVGEREVYRLSDEEWAGLSEEQQQGIIANYALYEASLRDNEAAVSFNNPDVDEQYGKQVEAIFGEKGGSKYYAPETVRVLNELGYTDVDNNDLDNFLNGSAIASYEDILGKTPEGEGVGRRATFNKLMESEAFDAPEIGDLLSKGTDLLGAVSSSGQFSNATLDLLGWDNTQAGAESVAGQIDPNQQVAMRDLLTQVSNKDVWGQIQNDPEAATQIQQMWTSATNGLDEDTVAKYMLELYDANDLTGYEGYMSRDEFIQNWLEKKG